MALIVKSYGNGSLGDVSTITATVNSCAAVSAISKTSITLDATSKVTGTATFDKGAKVLIHVSATTGTTTALKTYLGNWLVATVTAVNGNVLTIDEDPTKIIPADSFAKYYVQVVAFAQYRSLTLGSGVTIVPTVYSEIYHRGGIAAIMCSDTLTFNGGNISLADRGIPTTNKALRPELKQETNGEDDIDNYSAMENYCADYCPLNVGDGAAFIFAKKLIGNANSRIGNVSTYGVQFYRGQKHSVTYNEDPPANVTGTGGSSIFIAAKTITNFSPKMIAKYRSSASTAGQGLCRCYIASDTKLRNDEGLYSYDVISDPARLSREMNIKNFGNGSLGDVTDSTTVKQQLNNYATITAINGKQVTIKDVTTEGLAQIQQGALVMIHFNHKGSTNITDAGRFILANVVDEYNGVLTLDTAPPSISITNYAAQVVAIPQFNNFTLTSTNKDTPAFDGAQGGIFAIAVKDTFTAVKSAAFINVEKKGGGSAYARPGLAVIGNAQDCNKLPIGQGHGSAFILAKKIVANATYTHFGRDNVGTVCPYRGYTNNISGSGAGGGVSSTGKKDGGYGSNGTIPDGQSTTSLTSYCQGVHMMIVADTIEKLGIKAIATAGGAGVHGAGRGNGSDVSVGDVAKYQGGYNGGGTNDSCGGGSSGWAFVYCNHAVDQDTDYVIYRD